VVTVHRVGWRSLLQGRLASARNKEHAMDTKDAAKNVVKGWSYYSPIPDGIFCYVNIEKE